MPTELEELVGFLGSRRPEIRQLALEHAAGHSQGAQSDVFLKPDLKPVRDLKIIVNDIPPRARLALTILINLCDKAPVLACMDGDDVFLELLLVRITDRNYANADQAAMLLANMTKSDKLARLVALKRVLPAAGGAGADVSTSPYAMDQLMDCFVKGAEKGLSEEANYDFLSYVFADLSRLPAGRAYFVTKRDYDGVIPISKLVVFTEHKSLVRRKGVASTIKNCCFDISSHQTFLSRDGVNLLPYLLLPLMGSEGYSDEDTDGMPEEVQLLPPDKTRDPDPHILATHLESLLLLTSTRAGRGCLLMARVYPIVRETHLHVEDMGVAEACDRIVQVLMVERDLAEDPPLGRGQGGDGDGDDGDDGDDDAVVEIL